MSGYTLYGGELSLFTRKLEAAMHFYQQDFVRSAKTPDNAELIETRAGTHQVPVLHTPENWMIADTTPLLDLLDGRFPARAMFPPGALGLLVHLLEEHLDEWGARVMVHYRWHYPESAAFAAERMANGNPQMVERMLSWGPRACRATGTESPTQQQAAEAEYERLLAAAEAQLAQTPYLLGDRPTAVDCMVLGGLHAHTNMDPDPKKVVARYPRVRSWAEQDALDWDGEGDLAPLAQPTGFARHLLSEMATTYRPYVLANRDAQAAGAKAFQADIYGESVSYLSRPYPEQSRRMVAARIAALSAADHKAISVLLQEQGLSGVFG